MDLQLALQLLILTGVVAGVFWIFSLKIPGWLLTIFIIVGLLLIGGFIFGTGFNLAIAADTKTREKICENIGQMACNDIIKTYENNKYYNIAIIQRAQVLQELYLKTGCPAEVLAKCVTDNYFIEENSK